MNLLKFCPHILCVSLQMLLDISPLPPPLSDIVLSNLYFSILRVLYFMSSYFVFCSAVVIRHLPPRQLLYFAFFLRHSHQAVIRILLLFTFLHSDPSLHSAQYNPPDTLLQTLLKILGLLMAFLLSSISQVCCGPAVSAQAVLPMQITSPAVTAPRKTPKQHFPILQKWVSI